MAEDEDTIQTASCSGGLVGWRTFPYRLSAGLLRVESGGTFRLTVEQTADGVWEWIAWSALDPNHCLDGRAASMSEARRAAEQAGCGLARIVGSADRPDFALSALPSSEHRPN